MKKQRARRFRAEVEVVGKVRLMVRATSIDEAAREAVRRNGNRLFFAKGVALVGGKTHSRVTAVFER